MYTKSSTFLRIMLPPHFYFSMFNTAVKVIKFLTHEEFSISLMFVSFTLLGGNYPYNLCLFVYFTILGEDLIIALWKHDLSFKWPSALQDWDPGRNIYFVGFLFSSKILSWSFHISTPNFPYWTVLINSISTHSSFVIFSEGLFWFHTRTIFIKIFSPDFWLYILVINISTWQM